MTAEEVALGQFRSAVALVRVARKSGRDSLGYLTAVYMLARIIRAIRAEREGREDREEREGREEREEREATPTDETRALVDEPDKSGRVYVTIECDGWRCRLALCTREWMLRHPYVAAQVLCETLMEELARVLSQEDTDDDDA